MAKRLISSFVGIIILFLVIITNNIYVFNFAVTVVSLIGVYEFYNAFAQKDFHPMRILPYILTLLLLFVAPPFITLDLLKNALIILVPLTLLLLFITLILCSKKHSFADVIISVFGIIYVPFLLMFLILTRQLEHGEYMIWFIFFGAWITDAFAFFIGSKLGKHKLTSISPNKSIEGAIAGILFCALFYGAYTYYLNSIGILNLNIVVAALFGAISSIVSQIGDISASAIKRYCNIKDFGSIMPGHGGVLDRFDSILMVSPFVYIVLQFII